MLMIKRNEFNFFIICLNFSQKLKIKTVDALIGSMTA